MDAVCELKVRAEILQKEFESGDPEAIKRLRSVPERPVQRRHCLQVIAREFGFASWTQMKNVLSGEEHDGDFGTLLCPPRCAVQTNLWYRDYAEAAEIRAQKNRYLLGYRKQFFVVDRYFLDTLGLDPDDPDWALMGFDWVQPLDVAARARLYAKLIGRPHGNR